MKRILVDEIVVAPGAGGLFPWRRSCDTREVRARASPHLLGHEVYQAHRPDRRFLWVGAGSISTEIEAWDEVIERETETAAQGWCDRWASRASNDCSFFFHGSDRFPLVGSRHRVTRPQSRDIRKPPDPTRPDSTCGFLKCLRVRPDSIRGFLKSLLIQLAGRVMIRDSSLE